MATSPMFPKQLTSRYDYDRQDLEIIMRKVWLKLLYSDNLLSHELSLFTCKLERTVAIALWRYLSFFRCLS